MTPDVFFVSQEKSLCSQALEKIGNEILTIQTFVDPKKVLDVVFTAPPKLLIQDIDLKGINGKSLYNGIKFLNPTLPVITLLNPEDPQQRKYAAAIKGAIFMSKPVDWEHLRETAYLLCGAVELTPTP